MAFNEAVSLEGVTREILATLRHTSRAYEVVIVDDGSTDGTAETARRLAAEESGARRVSHATNQGLGGVYRTGFSEARQDLVTFFPADGQFPPSIIEQFLPLMAESDIVLGYLPNRRSSVLAKALSGAERVLYRLLFGTLPRFQGILMFRRALLRHLPLKSSGRGWAVLMELIIRASRAGYRLRSVPTEMRPRRSGGSKVQNIPTIASNLAQVFALRLKL